MGALLITKTNNKEEKRLYKCSITSKPRANRYVRQASA